MFLSILLLKIGYFLVLRGVLKKVFRSQKSFRANTSFLVKIVKIFKGVNYI